MSIFFEMLSFPFLVRSLIVGILVSICASLLGSSLVLKRYSMIGDSLSHVGFMALAIAYPFSFSPLYLSIPVCVASAFLLLQLKENSRIKGDAATFILCSSSLAIGVMTISLTTGMNVDVCNYMFGSILAMSKMDVYISVVLSIAVIILFVFFYNKIFAVTFDEDFSSATGINAKTYNMVIAILTAITVTLGMRMMGTLLISSLIAFPSLSAMRLCKRFITTIITSVVISIISFMMGLILSYMYSIPTGACIVIVDLVFFVIFLAIDKLKVHILK